MTEKEKEKPAENQSIVEEKITKVSGEVQIRKYIKGRLLGKGGFAKCYEFINQETEHSSAAKVIPKKSLVKSRAKQKLISEIKIHKSLHHPNIVAFEHYFEDSENVYLLIEICHNQTLNELLKRRKKLTELEVQCYAVQIIKALRYLHTHRVIHRDLKLGNLFISEKMEIKVGDFGLATKLEFDGERKRTVCGTPNYIAPEILEGKTGHSYEVDIWSLGVIMYTLIIGKPPFETNNVKETYKRIAREAGNQAHIIVAGYPKIISKDSIDPIFTSSDAKLINSKVSYFNNEIRKTVEKCQSEGLNISFVSVEEEFGDYGAYYLLPSKELINRIELVKEQDINEKFPVSAYSIHPNNKGAEVYAKCVQREIDRIESERTRIWGQVVDEKNNRVSGVKVILTDDNNEVNVTNTTDSNGNYGFELDYKKDRHYTVRFEKKGFETLVVTEDKGGNRITINSALTKLSGDYTEFSGRFFNYSKGGMYDIYLDDTGEFTVKYVKHDGYGSFKMESDGRFSPLTKTDDYTYTFTVESFQSDYEKEQENSHRYIPETDLKVGSEFRIYTRDAPDSVLPKSVIEWRNLAISMTYGTMINLDYSYILYDVSNDMPYFSEKSI